MIQSMVHASRQDMELAWFVIVFNLLGLVSYRQDAMLSEEDQHACEHDIFTISSALHNLRGISSRFGTSNNRCEFGIWIDSTIDSLNALEAILEREYGIQKRSRILPTSYLEHNKEIEIKKGGKSHE